MHITNKNTLLRCRTLVIFLVTFVLFSCGGDTPEDKQSAAQKSWTDDDVNAVVSMEYVRIDATLEGLAAGAPEACEKIGFNRFKVRSASNNAAEADASFLMVPGIFEGANGFNYIGKQMVYIAKMQHNRNFEVWAMDRRSNCIEDLVGLEAAEHALDADTAAQVLIDYYYNGKSVNGSKFTGFKDAENPKYLTDFGIAQTTKDMYAILEHMVPDRATRQEKVFVGGHSMGAIHTSIFLTWDLDGNPQTLDDAGYKNTAGVFALDSLITPVDRIPRVVASYLPGFLESLGLSAVETVTPAMYKSAVNLLESGLLPRSASVPGIFTSEAVALPEALGILAVKAPNAEHTAVHDIPLSKSLKNLLKAFHYSGLEEIVNRTPSILNYRYTNEAMIGLMFDDDFSPVGFLGTSLGHMSGGTIDRKATSIEWLETAPSPFNLLKGVLSPDTQFIATAPRDIRGREGPLYSWANFDEVANDSDPTYIGIETRIEFTNKTEEMCDIQDVSKMLYEGESNLTEWYFPLRLFIDAILAVPFDHAPEYGINTVHREEALSVPHIEFMSERGLFINLTDLLPLSDNAVIIPGMQHLDPLCETVNTPSRHQPVVIPGLIEFALSNLN